MKFVCMVLVVCVLSSCTVMDEVVPSYRVSTEGISGAEWESRAFHDIPARRVRPNVDFRAFATSSGEGVGDGVMMLDNSK